MTIWRPDPTFYPSPRTAMRAPPEKFAYVGVLNADGKGRPDALAVLDVDPDSETYEQSVGRVDMPNAGDELHHFGWNACSAALCPYAPIRTSSAATATTKSMRFISATAFALANPWGLLLLREPYRVPLSWRGKKHGWDPILVPKRKILPSLYGPPYMGSSAPCSPDFLEEFFSETEHIVIRCGESSRRRAGSRRIGHEGSRPFAMPRRSRLATCRPLVKP